MGGAALHTQSSGLSPVRQVEYKDDTLNCSWILELSFLECMSYCHILILSPQVAATVDDIEEKHGFNYESFFDQQIQKKKMDHSYRVFKKVSRDAANFPAAREFSWGKKEITVQDILLARMPVLFIPYGKLHPCCCRCGAATTT